MRIARQGQPLFSEASELFYNTLKSYVKKPHPFRAFPGRNTRPRSKPGEDATKAGTIAVSIPA
ncbi:hypothetical protein FVW20_04025 [Desulfovibrio oxamicus]|uniref:Transposase n=1 Tax=Nitratidesulfovibrio oxamicus TaxID=32016 RepID=A0ABS0J1A4_9BACT|nr:hypothetical protein [Nitratidesulfovibrio oxamicus]MBG3876218.1 hypothetical protein [Nitratidesulfovibrio oxamicus]